MSRPQVPEILVGFRERFWVLAILMETGWNSRKKELQQKGRRRFPGPQHLGLIPNADLPQLNPGVEDRGQALHQAPKSTRPSEVKKKRILVPSKLHSTLTSFMSSLCSRIFS